MTPAANCQHPSAEARLARLRARRLQPGEAATCYLDARHGNAAVKVLPGEWFVDDDDVLVTTTLGSCIAVCLWDRERRLGGINHFMLPSLDEARADAASGRYGAHAMELLVNALLARGGVRSRLEAKVFGGAAVIPGMTSLNVGERNTSFVLAYLQAERIPVVSQDVLDVHPRRLVFLPASGKAMVKRLAASSVAGVLHDEQLALQRAVAAGGSVQLF